MSVDWQSARSEISSDTYTDTASDILSSRDGYEHGAHATLGASCDAND